jgi:hypothetical protein
LDDCVWQQPFIAIPNGYRGAGGEQPFRDGETDALRSSGDDRVPARQINSVRFPPRPIARRLQPESGIRADVWPIEAALPQVSFSLSNDQPNSRKQSGVQFNSRSKQHLYNANDQFVERVNRQ